MGLEAYRDFKFPEPERTPLQAYAVAIAERNLKERADLSGKYSQSLGMPTQTLPGYFRDSIANSLSKYVEQIVEPNPDSTNGAASKSPSALFRTISVGDWLAVWDDSSQTGDIPDGQTASQLRSQVISSFEVMENTSLAAQMPDTDFKNIRRMSQNARKLSKDTQVEPSVYFTSDELYEELVRNTFTPKEYRKSWKKRFEGQSLKSFVEDISKLALTAQLHGQAAEDGSEVTITDEQYRQALKTIRSNEESMKKLKEYFALGQKINSEALQGSLRRFWGEDAIEKPSSKKRKK
jgi:hypothetical protein